MNKNITFTADEKLIARARRHAAKKGRSLQAEVRDWLAQVANQPSPAQQRKELDDLLFCLRQIRESAQQTSKT